jgi:PAS domain S-box-containing protein
MSETMTNPSFDRPASRWRWLLSPAVAVMNRLSYPRKFTLICVLLLAPLLLALWQLVREGERAVILAETEIEALRVVRPLHRLHAILVRSRILADESERGLALKRSDLVKLHAEIDGIVDEITALFDRGDRFAAKGRWASLRENLSFLKKTLLADKAKDQDALHLQLIDDLRSLLGHLGDAGALVLDSETESYYLIDALQHLPAVESQAGQLAWLARRSLVSDKRLASEQRAEFIRAAGLLRSTAATVKQSLDKVLKSPRRESVPVRLELAVQGFGAANAQYLQTMEREFLQPKASQMPEAELDALERGEREATAALAERVAGDLDGILRERVARLRFWQGVSLFASALAATLVVYLLAGFYAAVMDTVGALQGAARRMASGAMEGSVDIDARDELGQVVASFNAVARQLRGEWHQAREESARAADAEAMVREREAQTRLIVDTAHDAFLRMDSHGLIIGWNRQAEAVFGWSSEEALSNPLANLLLPASYRERFDRGLQDFLRTGQADWFNCRLEVGALRKDGRIIPVEVSIATPIKSGDGYVFNAFVRDITDRLRAERELREAIDRADRANQAKSVFLANMSHEIRTPLNAILGMSSLLMDTQLSEEQRQFARVGRASGEALLGIINDILDFSKIEAGKLELETQPFDLDACVEDALDLIVVPAGEKGVELAFLRDDRVPPVVLGDVTRVRQVLTNLLSNAAKFTQHGEIVVEVSSQALSGGKHEIRFAVRDTGMGIPAEKQDRLFQSFSQVDASTTRQFGGTGLGLAISKRLVELMGGSMSLASEPGKGSTFAFTIVVSAQTTARSDAVETTLPSLEGKRVLVVEDNAISRLILRRQLERHRLVVRDTASPSHALAWVAQGELFDLAIVDLMMPEMDGLTLAKKLHEAKGAGALPVVAFTSVTRRDANATRGEFAAFLTKPLKASRLREVLLSTLAGLDMPTNAKLGTGEFDPKLAARLPLRILVAEDVAINQQMMEMMLRRFGYAVDFAGNGKEVLQALERQQYDLILMDVQMPEMDGLECTRRIVADSAGGQRPFLVALTANALREEAARCKEAGMDEFLTKPIRVAELRRCLERFGAEAVRRRSRPAATIAEEIELWDFDTLAELWTLEQGGEPGLVLSFLEGFRKSGPEHLPALREAVAQGQHREIHHLAHRFKGAAALVGATAVADCCQQLETQARKEIADGAQVLVLRLEIVYHQSLEQMEAFGDKAPWSKKSPPPGRVDLS